MKNQQVMNEQQRLIIFDTTLRDGEQSPNASMTPKQKLRIALQLEKLGVDVIEAGFPSTSNGDFEAVEIIAEKIKTCSVAALARATKGDIDRAWQAIKIAKKPRLHIFIATSEIHMKHKLNMCADEVFRKAVEAVRYAKTLCSDIEFSAEDASRSDRDFLCRIFEAVINVGATTISIPDTVGYAVPEEFGPFIKYIIKNTPNIKKAIVSVHCHNDLGLATANTLVAIKAGAKQVEVTINGIGERAGNTALEEVVMSIKTRNNYFPFSTSINTELIYPTSRMVSAITHIDVQPNKAIVGANAFAHESGIHQDGMLKNPMTYEIIKPETIGLTKSHLTLGKHSGTKGLKNHLVEMGHILSDEELKLVFKKFKDLSDKKKEILDEDLEAIIAECIFQTEGKFKLSYLNTSAGTTVISMTTIKMMVNEIEVMNTGFGNGPIDAAYNAISKLTQATCKLERFIIKALTGGTDAQGEVMVTLRENGYIAIGKGSDPDIIVASAKAYIDGLNRMEYIKSHPQISATNGVK
jgi:2-isopropylmalate synthase